MKKYLKNILSLSCIFIIVFFIFIYTNIQRTNNFYKEHCPSYVSNPFIYREIYRYDAYSISCHYLEDGSLRDNSLSFYKAIFIIPYWFTTSSWCALGFGISQSKADRGFGCMVLPFLISLSQNEVENIEEKRQESDLIIRLITGESRDETKEQLCLQESYCHLTGQSQGHNISFILPFQEKKCIIFNSYLFPEGVTTEPDIMDYFKIRLIDKEECKKLTE